MSVIALLTDFGTRDHYAGVLKGVIAEISPRATVVDVTHDIEAHHIASGAFLLWQSWAWFPSETIFLVVVDPGVGTARRILIARYGSRHVVAPDNGLITFVHREYPLEAMCCAENRRYFGPGLSPTFHGRDIMAPIAAHLSRGVLLREFGRPADQVELLAIPSAAALSARGLSGRILHVDRFGTMITNVGAGQLEELQRGAPSARVRVNGIDIGRACTAFADVPPGSPVALIGSSGLLEIAVNRGRAIDRFGPPDDAVVEVLRSER